MHAVGPCLGLADVVVMLVTAIGSPHSGQVAPAAVYAAGLLAGVAFHLARSLPYGRALWHGCVLLSILKG